MNKETTVFESLMQKNEIQNKTWKNLPQWDIIERTMGEKICDFQKIEVLIRFLHMHASQYPVLH
jgi:hypothetical protein